jgi:hypothetical protein
MHHIVEFFIILFIRLVIFVLLNCVYMPLDFSLYPKGGKRLGNNIKYWQVVFFILAHQIHNQIFSLLGGFPPVIKLTDASLLGLFVLFVKAPVYSGKLC